jgi:putative transposase
MRKVAFVNGEFHHIYNRGVDKRKVFLDTEDFKRFLESIRKFNRLDAIGSLYEQRFREKKWLEKRKKTKEKGSSTPQDKSLGVELPKALVDVVCYCLNPNHFHLILKQLEDKGIEKFMQKVSTGYTNYFNKKHNRSGALFQGRYKSSHISSNEYLLHTSAYVNCNSEAHKIAEAENYEWCSFPEYMGKKGNLCQKQIVLGQFKDLREYYVFAKANVREIRSKKEEEKMIAG